MRRLRKLTIALCAVMVMAMMIGVSVSASEMGTPQTQSVTVTAEMATSVSFSIPKSIQMSIENGAANSTYEVYATGGCPSGVSVYIVPQSSFTMTSDTSGAPSVNVAVTQSKKEWVSTDLSASSPVKGQGTLTGSGFGAGRYTGTLYFNIVVDTSGKDTSAMMYH